MMKKIKEIIKKIKVYYKNEFSKDTGIELFCLRVILYIIAFAHTFILKSGFTVNLYSFSIAILISVTNIIRFDFQQTINELLKSYNSCFLELILSRKELSKYKERYGELKDDEAN